MVELNLPVELEYPQYYEYVLVCPESFNHHTPAALSVRFSYGGCLPTFDGDDARRSGGYR